MTLRILLLLCGGLALLHTGCAKKDVEPGEEDDFRPRKGYVTGDVKDLAGKPLEGVRIIVDHSIFFNSNIITYTNNKGKYKVRVPDGSWYAFASHTTSYGSETHTFYLHPENPAGFGGEGGVRDFTWRLTGAMNAPLSGNYGGLVTIDNFPGVYIDPTKIDFIFTPSAPLIDGSEGQVIRRRPDDAYQLKGIPIGRYRLTATYQGKSVKFRRWNSEDAFKEEYDLVFKGQIEGHCENCAQLEYFLEG